MSDTTFKRVTLDALNEASNKLNENNDCSVRAMAAATGKPYKDCHQALARHGRPYRKGPSADWRRIPILGAMGTRMAIVVPAMEKAARDLGYSLRVMDRSEYRAKTMITAARDPKLAKGRYICMVRGHVAAVVDGQVIDWSDGRRHQVKEVYEVVPSQDKTKTRESRPMKKMSGFSQGRLF